MFVLLGVSMDDGGERRRQFQELFPLMVLTPIGTILLGGSFPSIFSVFCGGSKINILLGLVNILALALSSMLSPANKAYYLLHLYWHTYIFSTNVIV